MGLNIMLALHPMAARLQLTQRTSVFQIVLLMDLTAVQAVRELEKELERYRHLQSEADAAKSRGGIWGYISGQ